MSHINILKDTVAHEGQFLQMIDREFENTKTNQSDVWEFVQRKTPGRIIAIVPVTKDGEVILIKSFRIPWNTYVIEICAGLMDKEGESEEEVARRELLEETGYTVESIQEVATGPISAGLSTEEMVLFIGHGAEKVREQELETSEDIEVFRIPIHDVKSFLLHQPAGVKVDMKVFSSIPFLPE